MSADAKSQMLPAAADDESDEEAVDWPEGRCGACDQAFHEQDEDSSLRVRVNKLQDAPEGVAMTVVPYRNEDKGVCQKCFYIKRGSLPTLKIGEAHKLLVKSGPLKDKFLVHDSCSVFFGSESGPVFQSFFHF